MRIHGSSGCPWMVIRTAQKMLSIDNFSLTLHHPFSDPHTEICVIPPPENSTLVPPTGFSLSEDVDTTPSFILTEYDLDPRVLRGCYEGLKSPKKVITIDKTSKAPINISGVVTRG